MIALLQRLLLFLLLTLDWAANPALLAPAVQPLAKPWCSTENVCPSGSYQQALLQESRPEQTTARPDLAADTAALESAVPGHAVRLAPFNPVCHLYVFLSLRR